jgi:phosphate-selective porin OprO/OprP
MSVRWIDFAERASVVTAVEPAQDIGAMLYGTILGRRVDWAAGVFNGQGRNRLALGDSFETTGRFVVNAWRPEATAAAGLWVGGSFGYADNERDVSDLRLQTQGTTRFLVFAPDVVRHGPLMRWGGELELVHGPVSLRGEYVGARLSGFRLETETADLILHGGYANLACVLTGERAVRNGPLRPRRGLESGGPGAFRLAARYQAVRSDHALLDRGLAVGTSLTQSTTIGLDWFPNVHLRMLLNYDFAWFDDAVLVGNRTLANEHVVTLRAQFNF